MAHDLGHPPFGHVAEFELDECAQQWGLRDGFEGNAQSFRILTRLAVHRRDDVHALDLTRATLKASLKYPWVRAEQNSHRHFRKFGVYDDDVEMFQWVDATTSAEQSFEAQVMDFADDVTFSVHDVEDFFRAGLIPVNRLVADPPYRRRFVARVRQRKPELATYLDSADNFSAVESLLGYMIDGRADNFHGWRTQEALLAEFRSAAITNFLQSVSVVDSVNGPRLVVPEPIEMVQSALKELIWDYVILSPRLAQQQAGQRRIVRSVFHHFVASLGVVDGSSELRRVKAEMFLPAMSELISSDWDRKQRLRFAVDAVASLTEPEAIRVFHKIEGTTLGSVMSPM